MNVSAVNCTPIRPKASSFGSYERDRYDEVNNLTERLNDKIVKADDLKNPIAVGASIALAMLVSYGGAKGAVSLISKKLPAAGVYIESGLKKAAGALKSGADSLIKSAPDSKFSKIKIRTGKILGGAENFVRSAYKKIAYSGIPKEAVNPERAGIAFANAAGAASALGSAAVICTADRDGDGVKDIMQKSQNVYTGAKTKYGNAMDTIGLFSEIIQTIS